MEMVDQVHGHKILIKTILQRTVFNFLTFSEKKTSGSPIRNPDDFMNVISSPNFDFYMNSMGFL